MIILLLGLALGCATAPPDPEGLSRSLKAAAYDYWEKRLNGNIEYIYKMELKEGLPPFAEYGDKSQAIRKFEIKSHSIKDLRVEGDKGTVAVEFSVLMPPVSKPLKQMIEEEWVLRGGKWFHKFTY
jgi:hypothetical protein